ncbi:hypothetical protein [Flavobacterium psychrotolerans]|uniref:Lipocalin-like domain-containing protein n=1 Tax=Flavobacterium psychrotolerans TaxID=2169410 RepID=A0A2U1JQZ0_9FLAO|nr:hypothetical protein [Flavobacterium psychrotolerans]PWA07248.1 hypothetical protein DB895_00555 [Flavobacterium psychrotolerans]
MKKIQFILIFLLGAVLFSCQKEEENVIQNPTNSLTKTSPLTSLLSRVSQYPTAYDNIIDGTSFCSVKLPVTIVVDNRRITVKSKSDCGLIAAIKEESVFDDDKVNFVYPITMIYRDFQQVVVLNDTQLKYILENYGVAQNINEIDCIDFNYPIIINSYDSNRQIAKTITVQSDSQLFNLLDNVNVTDFFGLVYPLTVTNFEGQISTISNNDGLSRAIENAIVQCGNPSDMKLSDIIVVGTWHISYFLDNNEDRTTQFYGYNFTFSSDGSVTAVKGYTTIKGSWSSLDYGTKKLKVNFAGSMFNEFNRDWNVSEFNSKSVQLKHVSDEIHLLYFVKN